MEDVLADVYTHPKLATIGSRVGAAFIDFLILSILFFGFISLWGERFSSESGFHVELTGLPALGWFTLSFLLMPVQEGITGKTLGKRIMGIKVVRRDYTDGSFGNSIARHIFDGIDCFFLAGLIVAASNPQRQRIGDLVSGTIVVNG